MALRSEKTIGWLMLLASAMAAAEFPATHVRARRDRTGVLSVDESGIGFRETKPKDPQVYRWAWNDIQRLVLSPSRVEITTYKDVRWQLGRDREFHFRGTGFDAAYPTVRENLPRRMVPEIAQPVPDPIFKAPAKRMDRLGGHEGTLLIGSRQIVFQSESPEGSHTWILGEIDNVSSSDPLELTISSLGTDYRIQLKEALPEAVYNGLWRNLNARRTPTL